MKVRRDEALDLFAKWFRERSLLRSQGSFPMYAFSFKARVVDLHPDEVRFRSDDTQVEFVLKLTDSLVFDYADSRTVTGQEAIDYECCLIALFGVVPDEGPANTLAFAQIA
jgi:hypothetical protein